MAERIALAALIWGASLFTLAAERRRSPFDLFVLLVLFSAVVGSFYPVLTAFVEPSTWRNVDHLRDALFAAAQWNYLGFALGLAAVACAARPLGRARPSPAHGAPRESPPPASGPTVSPGWVGVGDGRAQARTARPGQVTPARLAPGAERALAERDLCAALLLLAAGLGLYALYVGKVGLSALFNHSDYAEKYLRSFGLGPMAVGLKLAILACLWAEGGRVGARARTLFRLVALAISVWSVGFISVRSNFVCLLMGYAALACRRGGFELRRIRPLLVALLLAAYVFLEGFALLRGLLDRDLGTAVRILQDEGSSTLGRAIGGSELGHPFVTTMEVMAERDPGELRGASYLAALEGLLPLALHPERPPTLSQEFARRHYAELAARGGGTAFSAVAEAWLAFGSFVGPLCAGFALGALALALERAVRRAPDGFWARVSPALAVLAVIAHRSEAATLVKQVFIVAAPAALALLAAEALGLLRRARARARVPRLAGARGPRRARALGGSP